MDKEVGAKNASLTFEGAPATQLARIFVVCDQNGPAPTWGYILHQQRFVAILEISYKRTLDRGSVEIPGPPFRVACSSTIKKAEKIRNFSG